MTPGSGLAVGSGRTVTVHSRQRWNDTGIQVESGARYRFSAVGEWNDKGFEGDADGLTRFSPVHRLTFLRRLRRENWFALVGTIGRTTSTGFRIGRSASIVAPVSGRLWCFANDAWLFYGNNEGEVRLTVERES